jgi:hypothetical protein
MKLNDALPVARTMTLTESWSRSLGRTRSSSEVEQDELEVDVGGEDQLEVDVSGKDEVDGRPAGPESRARRRRMQRLPPSFDGDAEAGDARREKEGRVGGGAALLPAGVAVTTAAVERRRRGNPSSGSRAPCGTGARVVLIFLFFYFPIA